MSDSNMGTFLLVALVILAIWYYSKGSNMKTGVYKMKSGDVESYVKFNSMENDLAKFPLVDEAKGRDAVAKARARFYTTNCTGKEESTCAKFDPATEKLASDNVWLKGRMHYNRLSDLTGNQKNRYTYNPYKNRLSPWDVKKNPVYTQA